MIYSKEEMEEIYQRNVDMVYRICFAYIKNAADSEDAVQNTFLKLFCSEKRYFTSDELEYEKAWLIRAAQNVCKDYFKSKHSQNIPIQDCTAAVSDDVEYDETLEIVLSLPEKYRLPIYLYYYEGYSCNDIADTLKKSPVTVRSLMYRARKMLKGKLSEDV